MHRTRQLCGLLLAALVIGGCLTPGKTNAPVRYFLEPKIEVAKAQPTDKTLGVRTLEAARVHGRKIAHRDPGYVLGSYDLSEWADLPADVVTRALIDAVRATGRFKDVGEAINMNTPDLMLTGQLRKFEENRTSNPWTADCEVHLEVRSAMGPEAVWSGTLSASVPLEKNDVSVLPPAMSAAVAQVADQAAAQIAAAR